MTLLWFVTSASLIAALLAWRQARRAARKLEQLSQLYWELKYQYGEQRVQLQRLAGDAPSPPPPAAPARTPTEAFVPLSTLKR